MRSPFRSIVLGLAAAGVSLSSAATAQNTICLIAELEGVQEVPPNPSAAKGTACFTLDPAAKTLRYEIAFDGLTAAETGAHIHGFAPSGINAGVKHALPGGLRKSGVWNYAAGDEAAILAGLTYVNIHSAAFPGGEIRGQILRDKSNATLIGTMDGGQQVPPTTSPATGVACFSVDTTTNTLRFQITQTASLFFGAETGAHIHGFAGVGANGPVQFLLPNGFHKKGSWVYPEVDEAAILAGLTYVNIHTAAFGGGEVRGQMTVRCSCNPNFTSYCTAGTSANGCKATLSASGFPSATCPTGFKIAAADVEGNKNGIFFFGVNGQQANVWGNGTSFQCVVPPVKRAGLLIGAGAPNTCDGTFSQDLNALWCPSCPKPGHNPGVGTTAQVQLWYRDPQNTSNQTTSLSDALEFTMCP